jgi:hypothetical protein
MKIKGKIAINNRFSPPKPFFRGRWTGKICSTALMMETNKRIMEKLLKIASFSPPHDSHIFTFHFHENWQ